MTSVNVNIGNAHFELSSMLRFCTMASIIEAIWMLAALEVSLH
jgi:hypothetical protein